VKLDTYNASVLLLDQHGHFSQQVAICLGQARQLRLHVLSDIPWPAVRGSRFVRSFHQFSRQKDAAAQLVQACRATRAEVVLPVGEFGYDLLHRCQAALPPGVRIPPLTTPSMLAAVTNKYFLAQNLARLGFPSPVTLLFTTLAAARAELDKLTFPVLIKPIFGGAGVGIVRFETPDTLLRALESIAPGSYIIQSLLPGRDVDCSVLCRDGKILAHTIQTSYLPRRNPYAVDTAIRFLPHPALLATAEKFVAALGWNGVIHLDTREDPHDGRIHIIDVSARFWETLTASLAAGVNFPLLSCLAAQKIPFDPPEVAPITFFAAKTPLWQMAAHWSPGCKSGLAFALGDPVPRLVNLAKRIRRAAKRPATQTPEAERC